MRISDWSSDVCSSDLRTAGALSAKFHRPLQIGCAGAGDRHETMKMTAPAYRLRQQFRGGGNTPDIVRGGLLVDFPRSHGWTRNETQKSGSDNALSLFRRAEADTRGGSPRIGVHLCAGNPPGPA